MKKINKILVPIDFSETSDAIIDYAINVASVGAKINLLHIIEIPVVVDPLGYSSYMEIDKSKDLMEEKMSEKVALLQEKYGQYEFSGKVSTQTNPVEMILRTSHADYDLIVMGSHGKKGFERVIMGSVSESILRESKVSVMILKII